MIIARETTETFKDDAENLFEEDWRETNPHADKVPLAMDVAWYEAMEKQGNLYIFTARDNGKLCGYMGYVKADSKHHKTPVFKASGLFVARKYRGKRLAVDLLKDSLSVLKQEGSCMVKISSGSANDIGPMLKMIEPLFEKEEIVYSALLTAPI